MLQPLEAAKEMGLVLRYIARFEANGKARVGVEAVRREHPMASLLPCDNVFAIESRWYRDNPLVIRGPGAGRDVTAGAAERNEKRRAWPALYVVHTLQIGMFGCSLNGAPVQQEMCGASGSRGNRGPLAHLACYITAVMPCGALYPDRSVALTPDVSRAFYTLSPSRLGGKITHHHAVRTLAKNLQCGIAHFPWLPLPRVPPLRPVCTVPRLRPFPPCAPSL